MENKENKLDFNWERFTEKDFNDKKNDLLNERDWNRPALIDVGAVNIELHDPEYSSFGGEPRVFLDYYIGGDTSEHSYSYGTDIPYGHVDGSSIPISKIVSLSYEEFKIYLENEVTTEFNRINNAQNKILLEAERPTVNFDNPKQGAELYITKLAEKVDLAEQKDRRTWQFVRDNHPGFVGNPTGDSDITIRNNDVYRSVVAGEMSVEAAEKFVDLRGTKADFAREFIKTESEILDDAIYNWQPEPSDANENGEALVPDYVQEFYKTVKDVYSEMDRAVDIINFENEKDKFIKSLSGWELNQTIEIDNKKYDQYFIYPTENLDGIEQKFDKDGKPITSLKLVVAIDKETNDVEDIEIDRLNDVTGEVDANNVETELLKQGQQILNSAKKGIKEYILKENARWEKEQNLEKMFAGKYSIDDGNNHMTFRETLDFYNREDNDLPYEERLNYAVSRMLYNNLYLPDDEAGEKRWQICDETAKEILSDDGYDDPDDLNEAQYFANERAKDLFGYTRTEQIEEFRTLLKGAMTQDPDGNWVDFDGMKKYFDENETYRNYSTDWRLAHALSHMLMFSIEDFKSLSPENYDDITQDGAAAELRWELCDRISNDLVFGKIKDGWNGIIKEVETYSKEIADKEIEKLKESEKFVETEIEKKDDDIAKELDTYKAKLSHFSKENESRYLQKVLEYSLDMTAVDLPEVEYSRENYNKFFNRGEVNSPIGKLKMGDHQFEKFNKEDRKNLIKAAYETLTNPSLIISKETYDEKSESFKPLNVFGKSFYRIESGHKRVVESVVVLKNDKNIVIGSHNNDVDNFVRQIKTADQIIYADESISRVIAQLDKEVGNHVLLYSQKTEAIQTIPQNENLSNQNKLQEKENIMTEQKEIQSAKKTLLSWATQDTYDEADGLTGKEIFEKYDNTPVPIAILPEKAEIIFDGNDRNIYCGKAYFIDHMVNHHSELDISEYESLQDDLDNFDKVYLDPKNESVAFEHNKNNKKYSIIVKQDLQGHLLFYKSYHYGDKTKKRFVKIDLEKLREKLSVEVGNPSINHLEDSRFGRLLSALTDNKSISQSQNLSNQNKSQEKENIMTSMAVFNELTKAEFLKSYSYLNKQEYDATVAELKEQGKYTVPWNTIKEILGKDKAAELDYERNLHIDEDYEPEEKEFLSKFDAAYFTIEKYISHRGLDMDTYKDLFGDISEEQATEIEDAKKDILGNVVEELVKGTADYNGLAAFKDFSDIQQAYDRALAKSKIYQKYAQAELTEAIGKRDNSFVRNIADYLYSAQQHYETAQDEQIVKFCRNTLGEALFTAETELNSEAFKSLLENGADIGYQKTEIFGGKEYKANILHYIAADDNTEALSVLYDLDYLSQSVIEPLLQEKNFEGRTPLEVSENYYREEPSRYEPDMIMPDVMRELAHQEEEFLENVPPVILTDKLTGNILMVEQNNGDGYEINLFDKNLKLTKNLKLIDHDNFSGYTNNLGESVDCESNLEAARVAAAEYEKQGLWGNFYDYTRITDAEHIKSLSDSLHKSRDEFFKTIDELDKKLNPKLTETKHEPLSNMGIAKFSTIIPKDVFDKLGIDTEENEDFYQLVVSLNENGKVDEWYLDAGSAMAGVGENLDVDFSPEENNRFYFLFEKVNDVIREKYPHIKEQIIAEEKGTRTVTQSVTFPAHFIMAEKKSLSLLENLQDKYGFGENDFEQFVNNGDVDIHFAVPVPKEYQFPKSKTDEWIKSVCKDLEENFGSTDVAKGMDGSERVERVFDTVGEAENFVAENREYTPDKFLDRKSLLADKKELTDNDIDTILELSPEEINISSLENFTNKKFTDLSISEKTDLINKLENADYKKYKNSFLSTSKLLYEKSETLSKEIKILKSLDELNYTIYLLPYGYARNNQDFMQKSTDSILKHQFLEMKSVSSAGKNAGYNAFRESKKQAENAILSFEQDVSQETALNNVQRSLGAMIKGYKEQNLNYDMSGSVFLHFEKTGLTKLYEINRDGKTKEINVKNFGLKNTREFNKNSQVEAEVTEKPIEQPQITISQNENLSIKTEKNSEEKNTVAGAGVAPTISALRFPEEQPATRLRPSPTTITESIAPQTEKSSEAHFKDFVKEVEAEYRDLRLFRKATANVLKRLPPEQKAAIKSELLKRGANNPESLALVMKNEVQKQHSQKKNQERNKNRNDYEMER